jgi:hypothetical protein
MCGRALAFRKPTYKAVSLIPEAGRTCGSQKESPTVPLILYYGAAAPTVPPASPSTSRTPMKHLDEVVLNHFPPARRTRDKLTPTLNNDRPIGLLHATAMVVAIIIDASIFVQPSEINRHVPTVGGVLELVAPPSPLHKTADSDRAAAWCRTRR